MDSTRLCRECQQSFVVTDAEQAELAAIAQRAGWARWHLPNRCTACRFAARKATYTEQADQASDTVTRRCQDCQGVFTWPSDDGERQFYADRGWCAPRRCESCRQARREAR